MVLQFLWVNILFSQPRPMARRRRELCQRCGVKQIQSMNDPKTNDSRRRCRFDQDCFYLIFSLADLIVFWGLMIRSGVGWCCRTGTSSICITGTYRGAGCSLPVWSREVAEGNHGKRGHCAQRHRSWVGHILGRSMVNPKPKGTLWVPEHTRTQPPCDDFPLELTSLVKDENRRTGL